MKAPAWLRLLPGSRREGDHVVFRFTIDDQHPEFIEQLDRTAEVSFQLRCAEERRAAQQHVEALVDRLGQGYGIDPVVWASERTAERRARRIADRRARLLERQDPKHPDFIGRRQL